MHSNIYSLKNHIDADKRRILQEVIKVYMLLVVLIVSAVQKSCIRERTAIIADGLAFCVVLGGVLENALRSDATQNLP